MEDNNNILDQICHPIISKVQEHLLKEMLLSHPDYEVEKYLYIYIGDIAFACAFWKKASSEKKEFVEFWSKRWINDITKYTEEEKYSLATREAIKHFAALMQIAPRIFIYTSSPNFTQIANYFEMRSAKAAHYMLNSHTYLITFQTKQAEEFALLNEKKIDLDLPNKLSSIAVAPLARFFKITAQEIADIRIVRTDGSFRKSVVKGLIGAIGVY